MDGIQTDAADFLSVQYARRLQYEYDHEVPQKRKAAKKQAPDRSLIDDQEQAFNLSSAQDKAAAAAKLAKAEAARNVEEQARKVEEQARKVEAAKQVEQAEEVAPLTPAELRERRIKAFSKPTAN